MQKSGLLWVLIVIVLSIYVGQFTVSVYAQSQSATVTSSKLTSENRNSAVSITASIPIEVNNETLKIKEGILRSAVLKILETGPNMLKTSQGEEIIVKTKITNQINNATQSVDGTEATNAMIGIEISKALRSLNSPTKESTLIGPITVNTNSTCKPTSTKLISCENSIVVK